MDAKLQEVLSGKAPEYLEPLAALQENMQIRMKVAGELCIFEVLIFLCSLSFFSAFVKSQYLVNGRYLQGAVFGLCEK